MNLLPFEPVIPFTLGQIIVWYVLLAFCASLGATMSLIICDRIAWTKTIVGVLFGMCLYLCVSWLFQSEASMEFAKVFNKIP